jgi:DNA polymerase-1
VALPKRSTLYLIDGSAQIHRAYFAIRGLATRAGLPTNATYGFTTMLRKLLQDHDPRWCAICLDVAGPTFRHEEYRAYKATRRKMEDDLAVQLPYIRRVCDAFCLPTIEVPGFEADDVMATLAERARESGFATVVVSGDKDLLQLVSEDVLVLDPGREGSGATLYDRATVEEKFGVPPERVIDVLALVGDAVDNVPGVAGIGEKGARELVREFGPLEEVLAAAEKVKRTAYREGLLKQREQALMSKHLVTLRRDVPVALDLPGLARREPDRASAYALFSELEFVALAREFEPPVVSTRTQYEVLVDQPAIAAFASSLAEAKQVAVSLVSSSPEPMRGELLGIGLSRESGRGVYIPLWHPPLEVKPLAPRADVLAALAPVLENPSLAKLSARGKRDRILLSRAGVRLSGLTFDLGVASYLLNPGHRRGSPEELAPEYLGERPRELSAFLDAGERNASLDSLAEAAAQDADLTLRLVQPLLARLEQEGLASTFSTLELPLIEVLAEMEQAGVKVNLAFLCEMSAELEVQLSQLTQEIHALAGGEFNINSPLQLREVLFERLGLRAGKKTAKTRAASTAEEVLEELAQHHALPRRILDYRGVQKLKSTYVDALPDLVNPETGRIHAFFQQTVAATGRLSVTDPNLQNIPIRTAEGRRIREAFVAEPGHLLLSADYSQIELRILAHLSSDPVLVEAFRRGEDIHDRTSLEVFGPFSPLPKEEQRRRSKMVNYALLYGKTAFTLAKDLEISRKEAEEFIEAYFARYPTLRRFTQETVARGRETGIVRTLLGRLRRLPDLRSPNVPVRMEAERQAINTVVQGSAADLIKKAMVDLHAELRRRRMAARLILQIHDELLLELPEHEGHEAAALVRKVMEEALPLAVPLQVDARLGASWADVH